MKTYKVVVFGREFEVYYDPKYGWTIVEQDKNGYQVGEAQYAESRDMAFVYVGIEASRTPKES